VRALTPPSKEPQRSAVKSVTDLCRIHLTRRIIEYSTRGGIGAAVLSLESCQDTWTVISGLEALTGKEAFESPSGHPRRRIHELRLPSLKEKPRLVHHAQNNQPRMLVRLARSALPCRVVGERW
jgi:hypothetical protein